MWSKVLLERRSKFSGVTVLFGVFGNKLLAVSEFLGSLPYTYDGVGGSSSEEFLMIFCEMPEASKRG